MWFDINASGINITLRIKGYKTSGKHNWDSEWCQCDFIFASGDWLNYQKEDDEVLLCCEVEGLEERNRSTPIFSQDMKYRIFTLNGKYTFGIKDLRIITCL